MINTCIGLIFILIIVQYPLNLKDSKANEHILIVRITRKFNILPCMPFTTQKMKQWGQKVVIS